MTREEAIRELSYIAAEMPSMECGDWKEAICIAIKALEQEPETGHWISDDRDDFLWKCSNCNHNSGYLGNRFSKPKYNFCPNCGARIVEPQESED